MVVIYLGFAWITGIFAGSFLNIPLPLALAGILPVLTIPLFHHHKKAIILTGLCLILFFCGAWYYRTSLPANDNTNLVSYNDEGSFEIKGIIDRDPEQGNKTTRLHLSAESIFLNDEWQPISGTALVFVPRYTNYNYGDRVLLEGEAETPSQIDDFDYEQYLAAKGIYSTFYLPKIEVIETGKGNELFRWIYTFRNSLSQSINKVLPEPQASLTNGILLGIRGGIPESTRQDFSVTGLSHLLAISGLHLSIIAGVFIVLGRRLFGRKGYLYVWLALFAVWLYAILTGLNPPVLRASIMVSLYLAAEFFGRQRSAGTALIFTAAVMTAVTPTILRDASFQMSFAAMAGLVFILPSIQQLTRKLVVSKLDETKPITSFVIFITEALSVSLAAVLAVWPLTAYYFGTVSLLSPLSTFFALPALPFIIGTGFLTGITGLVFLPVAQVLGWITWLFSSWLLLVVKVFSFIPAIEDFQINFISIIAYYLALAVIVRFIRKKDTSTEPDTPSGNTFSFNVKTRSIAILLTGAILVSLTVVTQTDDRLHVSFLDVGQGDAILIQKNRQQILIDGGPDPIALMDSLSKKMTPWDRTIEMVILTHPDADHITGLLEVLNRYNVELVMYSDIPSDSTVFKTFTRLIKEKQIPIVMPSAGQHFLLGEGIRLDILNPIDGIKSNNEDNDSVVCELTVGEINFLFTGDIMEETEIRLVSRRLVSNCTILKAAHHGSKSSTSAIFLNVTMPDITVISAGADNSYGHPSREVLQRLETSTNSTVYRTDLNGTIEFITNGSELWVITDK